MIRCGAVLFRMSIGALGLSLALVSAFAQEAGTAYADAAFSANENSYNLVGTVINSVTGEPVRQAAVQVSGQDNRVALTDHGGHFSLEGLAARDVVLVAAKPGYYQDPESHTTAIRVERDAPTVVVKLVPTGVISGRITNRDDQPLEGLQIRLVTKQNVAGQLVWAEQPNHVVTNDEGEFRIPGLRAGMYYVAADQSSGTTLSQRGVVNPREQVFAKVFFPGVPEMSAGTPIEVVPGGEAAADFMLSAEPLYTISGKVTGEVAGVSTLDFERKAGDDTDFKQTVSVQGGKFQANVPAGTYSVSGETSEGKSPEATVMIRADESEVAIPLSEAATIPVEVVKERANGQRDPVKGNLAGNSLQLESVARSGSRAILRTAKADEIPNVPPGTYRLKITTNGGWWVKSAESGGVDLLSDDLTVVEGEHPEPIQVTLQDGAGMVAGRVLPMGDPGHVLVLLVQPHGSRNLLRTTIATQGSFTIPGVPPGDYVILALDDGDRMEYANPDVLEPFLADAEPVSVQAHEAVTVNVGLTSVNR